MLQRLCGVALLFVFACGGEDPPPTFTSVQAVFTGSCAFSACHQGASPAGDMGLEPGNAYASIVDVASMQVPAKVRVKPGDPASSYLMDKVLGIGMLDQMPPTAPLSEERMDLLRAWIEAGAPNADGL
jgi:hypothetical protein